MGPSPPGLTNPPAQANQPTNQLNSHITPPYWFPPLLPPSYPHPPADHYGSGAHKISFPYGKYTCVS